MKRRRLIINIFILFIVIVAAFVLYTNRNAIFLGRDVNRGGENVVYTMDGAIQRTFTSFKNRLIICDNQGVSAVKSNGNVAWSVNFQARQPRVDSSGSYLLSTDIGGTDFVLIKNGREQFRKTLEGTIWTASVNDNGYVAVASTIPNYKAKIDIYTRGGEKIFSWNLSHQYPIDLAVADNGKKLVAALVSTADKTLAGNLAFVDIVKAETVGEPSFANCMFSDIRFLNNGDVLAISDVAVMRYTSDGGLKWNTNYNSRVLQKVAVGRSRVVLFFENLRNTSTAESYTLSQGVLKGSYEFDFDVESVSSRGNVIVASGKRDIAMLRFNARLKTTLAFNNDIRTQEILPNKRDVFVVHSNNVEVITP
ncbi:MAG: DUF5711 family protein [Clostridiales bacterium]|jgi:hypothetical protein|nr:DUF5711 family protein [Clostridiales bacterium]